MDYPLESALVEETNTIRVKRIKAASLSSFLLTNSFACLVPLFLFFGILAVFGCKVVWINNEAITGITGLFAALVMAPIFSLVFSILLWLLIYPGMVIRSFLARPSSNITQYIEK